MGIEVLQYKLLSGSERCMFNNEYKRIIGLFDPWLLET